MPAKTDQALGYASAFKVMAETIRAMMTPAPPPPEGYSEPEDLLSAAYAHKKYEQLLLEQDPNQKEFIAEVLRPGEASAKRLAAAREVHIQKLNHLLDDVIDRMEKAEQACSEMETRWIGAEKRLWAERLRPDSRDALERVLIAAIAFAFGHEALGKQRRTSMASNLEDAAIRAFGIRIDPKTVRRYVNQAIARFVR